jgi:hypothetical protein
VAASVAIVILVVATTVAAWVVSLAAAAGAGAKVSTTIVDRNGKLLLCRDGRRSLAAAGRCDDRRRSRIPKLPLAYEVTVSASMAASIRWRSGARRCSLSHAATLSPAVRPLQCNWRG